MLIKKKMQFCLPEGEFDRILNTPIIIFFYSLVFEVSKSVAGEFSSVEVAIL